MKNGTVTKLLATAVSTALVATPALAKKASNLTYINGEGAGSAENQLDREGFKHISSHKNSMGYVNSYWWHKNDNDCVVVEAYDGKVMTINDAKDGDCGHSGGGTAAAVGAVAGLAILGALLSSKSHHQGGKSYDERQSGEFDRGYKDGLYNAAYHNFNRDDAYAHGYEVGVDERKANTGHHHGQGGYRQAAQFRDLQGSRAAGGMSELEQRGFSQVDNFTSGNTRYSIQWRKPSRQCLQVTIADGRFYDIRDIQQHPRCR